MNVFYAFLRGINVGGKNIIPMADLRNTIGSLGFEGIRTWIASGNVHFTSIEENPRKIKQSLEQALSERFNYSGPVILHTGRELIQMAGLNPFRGKESGRYGFPKQLCGERIWGDVDSPELEYGGQDGDEVMR